jgi:1-acyl-sn-glycerol-3-phosphate acyltransferase
MIYLRSTLFALFLLVFTPIWAIICLAVFPFMRSETRYRFVSGWNKTVLWVLKWLCGIHYEIRGMEYMLGALDKPIIILSKHQSAWETIAYIALFPKQLCYVFKRELLWIPFFGWVMAALKMIHINRDNRETAALSVASQGRARLKEGKWIMLFPEGTRTAVGSHKPYLKGGARLATATGAAVIPVAHNAGRVWPRNRFLKYPGLVIISIGPVIASEGKTGGQLNSAVESWIETEMRAIDPSAYEDAAKTEAHSK